jgi:hypothetical protein
MARRATYIKVVKRNMLRAEHVKGMGDVAFKGFQCLNPECHNFLFIRNDAIGQNFEIACPDCDYIMRSGDVTVLYDYDLTDTRDNSVRETGEFAILHDDYVAESQEYKYCIVCNTIKLFNFFDQHSSRATGRQGECRLCKAVYNNIKNQTRLTEQHREAAQKRRLYLDLSGGVQINIQQIFERFNYKCFKCGKDLRNVQDQRERPLDHTLPARYLWPLTTQNATLLCREHNGEKSGKWPANYYSLEEQKRLAVVTGLSYDLLHGSPQYNPEALTQLQQPEHIDALLVKYGAYVPEIIKLRNRILRDTKIDMFQYSRLISQTWVKQANDEFRGFIHPSGAVSLEQDTDEM